MIRVVFIVFVAFALASCKSVENGGGVRSGNQEITQAGSFSVLIKFQSQEGLKMVLFQMQNLKLELEKEVSVSDNIYQLKLVCREFEVDGTIRKLSMQEGVEWAKRLE